MRKLSLLVLIFCIIPFLASAGGFSFRDEFNTARAGAIHGTVTQANMRLSLVDGAAFVDFSQLGVLTNHVGKYIKVCSVTYPTECVTGWIKAAGTAETLDSELVDGWTNHATYNYETFIAGTGSAITQAVNSSGSGILYKASTATAKAVYKNTLTAVLTSGTSPSVYWASGTGGTLPTFNFVYITTASSTSYRTAPAATTYISIGNISTNVDFAVSAISFKQVLTPSFTGATIVSASGGTTYNWATNTISTAAAYNDSAGYTYTISTDAAVAEVVNASAAEPGSGTRTVVDTYATTDLITNGGFETVTGTDDDGTQDDFGTWDEAGCVATSKLEATTLNKKGGTRSLMITTGSDSSCAIIANNIPWIASKSYTLTFWTRGDGTNSGRYFIYDNAASKYLQADGISWGSSYFFDTGVTGTDWTLISRTILAPSVTTTFNLRLISDGTVGAVVYFDDVSVLPTSGLLSIANGKLTFAGGKASANATDPGLWLPVTTRVAGKGIFYDFITPATSGYMMIGATTLSGGGTSYMTQIKNTGIYRGQDGVIIDYCTASTPYKQFWVSKPTGYHLLFKGGTQFPTWKLSLGRWDSGSANFYPVSTGYSVANVVDSIRIPTTLWLPTPIASDGFASAFGTTDGAGHAETTGVGSGGSGVAWTSGGATWSVSGGKAINTPAQGAEIATGNTTVDVWYVITASEANHFYTGSAVGDTWRCSEAKALDASNKVKPLTTSEIFTTVPSSTADVIVTAALVRGAGKQNGVVVGLDSAADPKYYVTGRCTGAAGAAQTCSLIKTVNGVHTAVVNDTTAAYSASAEIRVIRDGTSFRLYYNNAQVGATSTVADVGTYTRHGIMSTSETTNTLDNFTLYARGTSGEYGVLDSLMTGKSVIQKRIIPGPVY
jgi:hypothetical protein